MKNENKKIKINNSDRVQELADGAFEDELFLSELFKAEDARRERADERIDTERKSSDAAVAAAEAHERADAWSDSDGFMSPEEIDAFFAEIVSSPTNSDKGASPSGDERIDVLEGELELERVRLDGSANEKPALSSLAPEPTEKAVADTPSEAVGEPDGEVPQSAEMSAVARAKRADRKKRKKARMAPAASDIFTPEAAASELVITPQIENGMSTADLPKNEDESETVEAAAAFELETTGAAAENAPSAKVADTVTDCESENSASTSPSEPVSRVTADAHGDSARRASVGVAWLTEHIGKAADKITAKLGIGLAARQSGTVDVSASASVQSENETRSELERSVDALTYEQTTSRFPPATKKTNYLRLATLVVCACVFVYSVRFIANNLYEKYKSDSVYDEINSGLEFTIPGTVVEGGIVSLLAPDSVGVQTPTMDDIIKNGVSQSVTTGAHSAELAKVRASLEHLKNINSDLYGYIMIPGTNISYPIAQHDTDNDYYLDRAYNGEHLVNGSIFADVKCDDDLMMNYNTVLYGHNVTSGSMFNHVSMFFDRDFFENTLIYVYTFDGIFVYKPFSIHETEYDSGYVNIAFPTVESFVNFASDLRDKSDIPSDVEFKAESRILTLSTCTNGIYTRRYALHAYLVERITD